MKEESKKQTINNVMCWILFGVIIVVAPSVFHCAYRIIIGFNDDILNYMPDLLLVVLAVCCNIINMLVNGRKKVPYLLKWIMGIIFGLISIICWLVFFWIRFDIDFNIHSEIISQSAPTIFVVAVIIIVFVLIIGCLIEIITGIYVDKGEN